MVMVGKGLMDGTVKKQPSWKEQKKTYLNMPGDKL
jgi:hypothetical protein